MASAGITDQRTDGPRVRRMSDRGRGWLGGLEGGCKLSAYLDSAGIPTIGVGQTYWPGSMKRVAMGERISTAIEGLEMFKKTLRAYESAVDAATRDDITETEFDAFTSLCYNIGQRAFGSSTAVRRYNARAALIVVCAEVARWNRAGGRIDEGLIERRACETDLILHGAYRLQGQKAAA